MMVVGGVDGCRKGWVVVLLHDGTFQDALTYSTLAQLVASHPEVAVFAVDIPIGLPSHGRRKADVEARRFVGPRNPSVFYTPPREVLEAETYDQARTLARTRFGLGVSSQVHRGLRRRILEADETVRGGAPLIEAHPEVSFRALAGEPVQHPKRTWNGQMQRLRLLEAAGIHLPDDLGRAGEVAADDVLDAAAAAWTAHRYTLGRARSLPDPPDVDDHGTRMAIWY